MQNQSHYNQNRYNSYGFRPWGMEENQFCMLLHLSVFAGYIVPFAGLILPIVMWTTNKDESPKIDAHGKMVLNFLISEFIYLGIGFVLSFFCVGFFVLAAVAIIGIVFPIIGAIKATEGTLYKYPVTINFFELTK